MDAQTRAASIVFREARRAYNYTPADERPIPDWMCPKCEGDGCLWCHYTGEKPA